MESKAGPREFVQMHILPLTKPEVSHRKLVGRIPSNNLVCWISSDRLSGLVGEVDPIYLSIFNPVKLNITTKHYNGAGGAREEARPSSWMIWSRFFFLSNGLVEYSVVQCYTSQ